ncbi:MAG: tRNA (cytidine(56)-2'-O)-methyltransferase [Candidatus Kariarchaeaceae archaeon]
MKPQLAFTVLRLNHRPSRDKRVSTHIALTTRAMGGKKVYYSGHYDTSLEQSVERVNETWGGSFEIEFLEKPLNLIKKWEGVSVHLTMYGSKLSEGVKEIKQKLLNNSNLSVLIIVGGAKVPPEIFEHSTINLSVGNQPHSEIAALAVVLDRLVGSENWEFDFPKSRLTIIPDDRGKNVLESTEKSKKREESG